MKSDVSPIKDGATNGAPAEEEDNIVCAICLSGTVYEGNEILFCDKCNVAVHQGCYSVNDIPEGSWYCYPCSAGVDPTTTPCEVCPFTGGAYKPTFRTGKWAHSLCCQWIPEIYVTAEPKKPQPYLSLLNLDKKRYKLKCALCHNTKGAAVQCSFGRCTTSVHPWCALKDPQGFTRRVVVNPEGETLWEIFCKTHASAVSEPLKPKPKAKMSVPIQIEEPSLAGSSYSSNSAKKDAKPAKERYSDIGSYFPSHHNFSSARNTLTMAHAKNFNASCLLALKDGPAAQSDGLSATEHAAAEDEDVEVEGSEDEFFSARGRQASGSKQSKQQHGAAGKHATSTGLPSRGEPAAPGGSNSGSSFPILSMLEWPGISEGEPMDLDHFWNVVSGHYPEDHPKEWLDYMLADLEKPIVPQAVQSVLASAVAAAAEAQTAAKSAAGKSRSRGGGGGSAEEVSAHVAAAQPLWHIPPLGHAKQANRADLADIAEELLTAFGGERERTAVLDEDKRYDVLVALNARLNVIKGTRDATSTTAAAADGGILSMADDDESATFESKSQTSSYADFTQFNAKAAAQHTPGPCALLLAENEFYTKPTSQQQQQSAHKGTAAASVEDTEYADEKGCLALRTVFDGPRRFACEFKIHLPDPAVPALSQRPPSLPPASNSRRGTKWHQVNLSSKDVLTSAAWAKENLIPTGEDEAEETILSALNMREEAFPHASVVLESLESVADTKDVQLTDRVIIPRDEDNSLCRAIRTDVHAYTLLCDALQSRLKMLMEKQDLHSLSGALTKAKVDWDAVDSLYLKQQIWKQVCSGLYRGVRDQLPDFNKTEEEVMPASWKIEVQGRPKAEEEENEPEPHEDAVCMCCFDGTSVEGNRILFCDGCNAALHQICYGVPRIPEGDFFCDRCQYVKLLAAESYGKFDYYHAKTAVMCCLCPLQHGGLKPTTDGRWAHLACALWCKDTVIVDLTEMSPLNLSKVPVQVPQDSEGAPTSSYGRVLQSPDDNAATQLYRQNCTLSPITDACMFCNLRGGRVQQCCYSPAGEGNGKAACKKVFHPLCAWFEGLYMSSVIEDPTFQGKQRAGQYPSGLTFCFLCDAHSTGTSARPADRQPEIREEQQKLRCKYRIREDDLEAIPGQNRKRKKPKKKLQQQSMSLGRGAGGNDLKDLNLDVYDDKYCAACMEPINPDVFLCGFVPNEVAAWELEFDTAAAVGTVGTVTAGASATGVTPAAASSVASSAVVGGNVASGATAAPSAASVTTVAPTALVTTVPSVASVAPSVAPTAPDIAVDPIASAALATADISVPPEVEVVVESSEAKTDEGDGDDGTSGFDALVGSITSPVVGAGPSSSSPVPFPGPDPVPESAAPVDLNEAAGSDLISHLESDRTNAAIADAPPVEDFGSSSSSSAASEGAVETVAVETVAVDTVTVETVAVDTVAVDTVAVETVAGVAAADLTGGGIALLVDVALAATIAPVPLPAAAVGAPEVAPASVVVLVEPEVPVPASAPAAPPAVVAPVPANAYRCAGCSLLVHKCCVVGHLPEEGADWHCDVCLLRQLSSEETEVRCALCPRRGGYFKRTTDFKWAHLYCANKAPGQVRVVADGKVDIRVLPKENRKEKCAICNRKSGVCVQCSHVGCTTQFHPICGARSGKGCIRTRLGEKSAYCFAHLPEGLERMPSGHWVDGYEVERLRYCLERARLILDVLVRREKFKKMLCKAETELFSIRFHKMLDKAKKRKHRSEEDEVDLSDMSLYESESDYYTDDEGAEEGDGKGPTSPGAFLPLSQTLGSPGTQAAEPPVIMTCSTGEEVNISSTWIKRRDVRLPKRLAATFSGLEIDRKDVIREGGQRGFTKHFRDLLVKHTNAMRVATQIFSSATEEAEFGKSVAPKLKKHMAMPMEEFAAAMKSTPWVKIASAGDGTAVAKSAGKGGRPKKGYAYVYEGEEEAQAAARAMTAEEFGDADGADDDDDEYVGKGGASGSSTRRGGALKIKLKFRANSDLSDGASSVNKGRGRPRRQQAIDDWLAPTTPAAVKVESSATKSGRKTGAAAAAAVEEVLLSPGSRRGGRGAAKISEVVEEEEEEAPARKKTKKELREEREAAEAAEAAAAEALLQKASKKKGKQAEQPPAAPAALASPKKGKLSKKEQAAADAAAAAEAEAEAEALLAASQKKGKKNKRAAEEEKEVTVVKTEEVDYRTKRQRILAEETAAKLSAAPAADAFAVTPLDETNKLVGTKTKEDAKKFTAATLFSLERRLKDIMRDITDYEIPEDFGAGAGSSSSSKKSKKASAGSSSSSGAGAGQQQEPMRRLAEDFEEVPYDAIPEYDTLVERVVTLDSMQERLGAHGYKSMAEFSDDFYTLLNNARTITQAGSITWADSAKLAELFEEFKTRSLTESSASKPRAPGNEVYVSKLGGSSSSGSSGGGSSAVAAAATNSVSKGGKNKWTCSCCKSLYTVQNWPADFDISQAYTPQQSAAAPTSGGAKSKNASAHAWASELIASSGSTEFQLPPDFKVNNRDNRERRALKEAVFREQWAVACAALHPWQWICGTCVEVLGGRLVGADVLVWWHDDKLAYRGTIDAYDEVSKCHRVYYEDDEWEFVNLTIEPACFGSLEEFALPGVEQQRQGEGSKKRK